jgi:hypothetical protein
MLSDGHTLRTLNLEINDAENRGDRDYLANAIASEMAFFRANGSLDDGSRFLQKAVKKDSPGELKFNVKEPNPIRIYGNRAIVECIVSQGGKQYHNIRLFIRIDGKWKLLGWANEEVT